MSVLTGRQGDAVCEIVAVIRIIAGRVELDPHRNGQECRSGGTVVATHGRHVVLPTRYRLLVDNLAERWRINQQLMLVFTNVTNDDRIHRRE